MTNTFASLHSGLVARKGEATPAVSHASFDYVDAPQQVPCKQRVETKSAPKRTASAKTPQRASRASSTDRKERVASKKGTKQPAKFRLTFRMTHDQRRRMRIAMAQTDLSLQHILSDALDNHLDGLCACSLSECACMARDDNA